MIMFTTKAKVSELFCDKISLTLDIEDLLQQNEVLENIKQLAMPKEIPMKHTGIYRWSTYLASDKSDRKGLLVQCEPKYGQTRYFRCEFNPSRVDMAVVRAQLDKILPEGYESLFQQGRCTRIDLAVDIHGIDIESLLVWHPTLRISEAKNGDKGRIETYYLGSKDGALRFAVYDKRTEMLKKLKKKGKKGSLDTPPPDYPLTRIEARMRGDRSDDLMKLNNIFNPFEKLSISSYGYFTKQDEMFRLFLDSCRLRGAHAALKRLSKDLHDDYEKRLKAVVMPWWDKTYIWDQWPKVRKSLLDVPIKAVQNIGTTSLISPFSSLSNCNQLHFKKIQGI